MYALKYPVARFRKGNDWKLIKAEDADPTGIFYCYDQRCNQRMIKYGTNNSDKRSQRPHFRHKSFNPNCNPESALHYGFEQDLLSIINYRLENHIPLKVSWNCPICSEQHTIDILKGIWRADDTFTRLPVKPDIALIDSFNQVKYAIEIVVTHSPEESTQQYYIDHDIVLIQFNITEQNVEEIINSDIMPADIVNYCSNLFCSNCGKRKLESYMLLRKVKCWNCSREMNHAEIHTVAGLLKKIKDFDELELQFAAELKHNFKNLIYTGLNYNKIIPANRCNYCNSFYSPFKPVQYIPNYKPEKYFIRYICNCEFVPKNYKTIYFEPAALLNQI